MNFKKVFIPVFFALLVSYFPVEAREKQKIADDTTWYLYANFEVVGFEVKHLRQGLNITVGTSSLFQSPELEVFNVRADEAVSLEYHHYLVDSPDKGIYVGGGYFVRGNVFGKNTDTLGELTRGGAESTKPGVNVPFYAIFGEKIGFGDLFFFDMHVRVNERISPSIFFGFRF